MKLRSLARSQSYDYIIRTLCIALLLLLKLAQAYSQPVGEVNGRKIEATDYEYRVASAIEFQQQQIDSDEVNEGKIREEVFNQMIDELLIQQAAERLGINISNERLMQILLNDPPQFLMEPFTDSTGTFREEVYRNFMSDPRGMLTELDVSPEEIERTMEQYELTKKSFRIECLRNAIDSALTVSARPSPAEAYTAFRSQENRATGSMAIYNADLIGDDEVVVSEDEARNYFNTHRHEYQQGNSREVDLIIFPFVPSKADSNAAVSELNTFKPSLVKAKTAEERELLQEEWASRVGNGVWRSTQIASLQNIPLDVLTHLKGAKRGLVIGPVWLIEPGGAHLIEVVDVNENGDLYVRAQHILLMEPEDGNVDSVIALGKRLIKRATSGESFDKLAREYSGEPATAIKGGDLGYFGRGTMIQEFEDPVFKATQGSVIGPVHTEYGYHIIKINERSSRNLKLRGWQAIPLVSDKTRIQILRQAMQFRQRLASSGMEIAELGSRENLKITSSGPVRRNQPVAGSMKLSNFTFTGLVGSVSEVTVLNDENLAVAQIRKINNAGNMEYDDARAQVMARLRTEKKLDRLKDRVELFRTKLTPGINLAEQKSLDTSVDLQAFEDHSPALLLESTESDTAVVEAIFSQNPGEPSQPIRGRHGYYIIQVNNRTVKTERDFALRRDEFTEQLMLEQRPVFDEWLVTEREKAEIRDLRSE